MGLSEELFDRAVKVIPGGVNSPVRAYGAIGIAPRFIDRADGCHIYDVDGKEYVDYIDSWGPMILGHNFPEVKESVLKACEKGLSFGCATAIEVEMAEFICDHIPHVDMVRMVNSGTEAVMSAVRVARGFTGKNKIIKFAGCYHGHSDAMLVSAGSGVMTSGVPDSAGVPADFTRHTLVAEYNSPDSVKALFEAYPDEIADFCKLIRQTPGCAMKCHLCDRHACDIASRRTSSYTYHCHAGLTESIIPIRMGNIVIGYLLFGHVFSYTSYDEGWKVIRERCADYGISFDELEKCCRKLPNLSEEYIDSASHIMKAVASYLCMDRMVSMHQQELPVQIDEYIQSHYTERIDAVSIAQHFHIGKTKIYEIARQNYGMGIAEYIRKLRIDLARQLLAEQTDLSLAEIAYKCGFSDYNYFITVFKKLVGVPPIAYRQQIVKAE